MPPMTCDQIVEAIKQGIASGRYAPGQRLVEADLAAEFHTKRTPVREALRILAGDRVVELIPQRGARVRRLAQADLEDLMPVLAGIMRTTIKLAHPRLQETAFREQLEQAMQAMRHLANMRATEPFEAATLHYAAIIRKAADNRYLDYLSDKLHADLFHRQLSASQRITDWDAYLAHFELMHEALLKHDLATALALLDEHETATLALFAKKENSHSQR